MHFVVAIRTPEASSGDYALSSTEGTGMTKLATLLTPPAQDAEQTAPDYGTTIELRGATEHLFTGDAFADAVVAGGLALKIGELNEKPARVAVRKFTLDETTLICTILGNWPKIRDAFMEELRADFEEVFGIDDITFEY